MAAHKRSVDQAVLHEALRLFATQQSGRAVIAPKETPSGFHNGPLRRGNELNKHMSPGKLRGGTTSSSMPPEIHRGCLPRGWHVLLITMEATEHDDRRRAGLRILT